MKKQAMTAGPLVIPAQNIQLDSSAPPVPLVFSPAALMKSPEASFNPQEMQQFLNHVAQGRKDQVQAMLQRNSALVFARGDVNDLAGRNFDSQTIIQKGFFSDKAKLIGVHPEIARLGHHGARWFRGMTAVEYAWWALDDDMLKALLEHLKQYPKEAHAQIQALRECAWASAQGEHAGPHIQRVIQALQTYMDMPWDEKKCTEQWCKQVGGAQLLLPMHVINEYCHPTRSFEPESGKVPDFNLDATVLPRLRKFHSLLDGKNYEDVFSCPSSHGSLGSTFGLVRSNLAGGVAGTGLVGWNSHGLAGDYDDFRALTTLLSTRTRQREVLLAELTQDIGVECARQVGFRQ